MQRTRAVLLAGIPLWLASGSAAARVIVSELLWAGSDLSTADEWIELACIPGEADLSHQPSDGARDGEDERGDAPQRHVHGGSCDLSGWSVWYRDTSGNPSRITSFSTGTILGLHQTLLVSNDDREQSRLDMDPQVVTTAVTLPNTKLLVWVEDRSGAVMDMVDDGVGDPFAGMNATGTGFRASMERTVLTGSGMLKEHWQTASSAVNMDPGSPVLGTPGILPVSAQGASSISWSALSSSSDAFDFSSSIRAEPEFTMFGSASGVLPVALQEYALSSASGAQWGGIPLITEILADPDGPDTDEWIEVANVGSGTLHLAGLTLHVQTTGTARSYTVPFGSSSVLAPGSFRVFGAQSTGLPLRNAGDTVRLFSGSLVLDTLTYPAAVSGRSYGRDARDVAVLREFCTPTPGARNVAQPLGAEIALQSGQTSGVGKVTVNLQVTISGSALLGAVCHWDYGDGFTSESCNPPSHTFSIPGVYSIVVDVVSSCAEPERLVLPITVFPKAQQGNIPDGSVHTGSEAVSCRILSHTGVLITEILPNPSGDEAAGEWAELRNVGRESVSLCGWLLDDGEGGSSPYRLDALALAPGDFAVVPRSISKVALNNGGDMVRLFAPARREPGIHPGTGTVLVQSIPVPALPEDMSHALRDDGLFLATPFPTPGLRNRFRTAERSFPRGQLVVSAALPNPIGEDTEGEWVEIQNLSRENVRLDGWRVAGSSGKPFTLRGLWLRPLESRRLPASVTGITLRNHDGVVRLLDPEGYVASVLGWTDAPEGVIQRRTEVFHGTVPATLVRARPDGLLDVALTDTEDPDLPPSVLHRWRAMEHHDHATLTVQLAGVLVPSARSGVSTAECLRQMLPEPSVLLAFPASPWNAYHVLHAQVFPEHADVSLQELLLREGCALADPSWDAPLVHLFTALEQESQAALLGVWADAQAARSAQMRASEALRQDILRRDGLLLKVSPASGMVATGALITFTTNVPAEVLVSVNSGAWQSVSTGGIMVREDMTVHAYARTLVPGSGGVMSAVESSVAYAWYAVERKEYPEGVVVNEVSPFSVSVSVHGRSRMAGEWVELRNVTDAAISLAGWLLDDGDGGSRPFRIPAGTVISGSGFLLFSKEKTGIALNDDGDGVRLLHPDGTPVDGVAYPRMKRGQVWARCPASSARRVALRGQEAEGGRAVGMVAEQFLQASSPNLPAKGEVLGTASDIPTPGSSNRCITFLDPKMAPDRDRDFLPDDREELLYGTSPADADSDDDGWLDGFDVTSSGEVTDRERRRGYRVFVEKRMKPEVKLLKTKGIIVRGRSYPLISASVSVNGGPAESLDIDPDGSFAFVVDRPLPAGRHRVQIRITDIAGRSLLLEDRILDLPDPYPGAPERGSKRRSVPSPFGPLRERWVVDADSHAKQLRDVHPLLLTLRQRPTVALREQEDSMVFMVAFLFFMSVLCSGILLFRNVRNPE